MSLDTRVIAADHERVNDAEIRLYHAEVALEDARDSRVDAWIMAAADRLHDACVDYLACVRPHGHARV